jgi:programmed cell death 6-interacting protein
MDILDHEASEDEAARRDMSLNRLPSHEANGELIDKAKRYRSILSQATSSDEVVRQKWDEWENSIAGLVLSEVGHFYQCRLRCLLYISGGVGSVYTLVGSIYNNNAGEANASTRSCFACAH